MRRTKLNIDKFHCSHLLELAALVIILTCCFANRSMAQQPGQKTFSSPQEAANAFVTAVRSNDEKAMLDILGRGGSQIVSSGDETEDAENRAIFVQKYQEMNRLVKEPDGTTTLYIGAKNWPTPIPLVNRGDSWYFDTEAGKTEILFRRVGRNEISTIRVCQELVAAEKNYYSTQQHEYARKIFSDEGQHNGLYWKAADGEPQSPIGPLVASAVAEGYAKGQGGPPTPYHGYYHHILTRQGKNALGGARSYIVGGKMTGGFAFVAYPAEYRSSGVMTFIVGDDGVVYQKDLGTKTDVIAKAMTEYNPDSSWRKADEQQEQTGGQPLWQVGTIIAVQPYQGSPSDPSATSYKVSFRVGNTVYTVVHTPRPGTDIGQYAIGRALVVLIGDGTITYNDILGNSHEAAILSRTTVPAQGNL
jgi:hypothetical protein